MRETHERKAEINNYLKPAKRHKTTVYAMQAVVQPRATKDTMSAMCLRDALPISLILYRFIKNLFGT